MPDNFVDNIDKLSLSELNTITGLANNTPSFNEPNKLIVNPSQYSTQYAIPNENAAGFIQNVKSQNQPGTHQAFNATVGGVLSGAATAVEDISYLPNIVTQFYDNDYETNAIAETMQKFKENLGEELPIYRTNNGVFSWDDGAVVWDSLKGILDSAVGFGLPGVGIAGTVGKGVSAAAKASRGMKLLSILGESPALQQAVTSVGSGLIMNDLEGTMMGVELYSDLVDKGVDKELAAQKATEFKRLNRLFAITDALQVHGLFKGELPGGTRNILSERGILKNLGNLSEENLAIQGLKEGAEEIGQNTIQSEKEYEAYKESGKINLANNLSTEDELFPRILDLATSDKALYEGMLGFLGGGPQRIMSDLIAGNYGEKGKVYDSEVAKQQDLIKQTNEELVDTFKNFVKTSNLISEAQAKGDYDLAETLKSSSWTGIMLKNFNAGTTENLQTQLENVANLTPEEAAAKGLEDNYRSKAQESIADLKKSEKQWNKLLNYNNKEEIFFNIKKNEFLNKQYAASENKLQEAKAFVNAEGTRIASREISKAIKEKGLPESINLGINYNLDALENTYENPIQKKAYNQTVNYLKKTNAYKEYEEAKKNVKLVADKLAENDEEYAKITSPEYQKGNEFQDKLEKLNQKLIQGKVKDFKEAHELRLDLFTSKAQYDAYKQEIADNKYLSQEDKETLQKEAENAYIKEYTAQKESGKGIQDLDELYATRPLLLEHHIELFNKKYGTNVKNLEEMQAALVSMSKTKEEALDTTKQVTKEETKPVETKKTEEIPDTKFEDTQNINAMIHDMALMKFKSIDLDEKSNILDSSRVEISGLNVTTTMSYGEFKKKYNISEDTRDIQQDKYYTLKDKNNNPIHSTQNNVGVDLDYLRSGKLKEGDEIHYEVSKELNDKLPKNYQNPEGFSVLLVKYDNGSRIIVGELPAYKEGNNPKLLALRKSIYNEYTKVNSDYQYPSTNKVKDVFTGKFWNTGTMNKLDAVLKEGEPMILGVALSNEANQITLTSGVLHTDEFGIQTRELKTPDGETVYTSQDGVNLTPGVTYQIFKSLNGTYLPYRVFTSKVSEVEGFKQEILDLLDRIKTKSDYQEIKPIIDNWYVAKSKNFDFTFTEGKGFNFKDESTDDPISTGLSAQQLYDLADFDNRYTPVIVYDGTTPYLGSNVVIPDGTTINYNDYLVQRGILKTDVNPIQHFHSPKFNLDLDGKIITEVKTFDVKADTPQITIHLETAQNPFAEEVKENPEQEPKKEKKKFKKIPNKFSDDKPKERREPKLIKSWNKEQELAWFKQKYPSTPAHVLDDLNKIYNSGGKSAWGMFYNAAIYIKNNAGEGTTYHEAFHVAFNILIDEKQQQALIKEAKEKFNLEGKSDLQVEEFLADKFMDRILTGLTPKSFGAKIVNFFKKLWDTIRFSINNKLTLDNFFYRAEKGERAFLKFKRDVTKFVPKFRVEGLTPNEEYQAITSFRNIVGKVLHHEKSKPEYSKLTDKQFYKRLFDKNDLFENAVIKAYNRFVDKYFDEEGNINVEDEQLADKVVNLMTAVYDSENDKLGPLYDEVVRSFRMLGIKINYSYDTAANDQETLEENSKEGWQTDVVKENPQDNLSDRLKLWLSGIENIIKWNNANDYETRKNIFGEPETLGETQAYNYLLQNLANSTSTQEVKSKLENLAKSTEWVKKVIYDVEHDDKLLTDLYLMSQLNDTTFVFVSQKPNGQYIVSDSNSQAITKRIVSDWSNNFNSPLNKILDSNHDKIDIKKAEQVSNVINNLAKSLATDKESIDKLERILENTGLTVPASVIEQLVLNKGQYKLFLNQLNSLFNIIKQGKSPFVVEEFNDDDGELVEKDKTSNYILNNLATILKKVYPHYYQSSHINVEGNQVYNHIKASFMSRFFSKITNSNPNIKKATLENYKNSVFFNKSPLINELLDDTNGLANKLKFTLFDGTKRVGDDSGKQYSKLSEAQLNSTLINLYFNNKNKDRAFYGYPVLADTGNLVLVEHKKYTPEAALEGLYQTALQEWDRINSKRPNIKNYEKNGADFVIFDFLNSHKTLFNFDGSKKDEIKVLIKTHMDKSVDEYKNFLVESNVLSKVNNNLVIKDKSIDNRINPNTFLTEFVYADTLMQIQLGTLLSGDPAFYKSKAKGGVEDFYKRNKQVWAPKTYLDVTKMDSPVYKLKILKDVEDSEVSQELVKKIKENLQKAEMSEDIIKEIVDNYTGINETDAQAYIDLVRYREIEKGRNRWSPREQEAFDRIMKGDAKNSDFVVLQPFKPFVFTHLKIDNTIIPLQLKNSELLLTPQYAEGSEKLMKLMTDMGYTFKDGKYVGYNAKNRKVDSIMFQSAVKAGEHKTTTWDNIDKADSILVANEDYGIQQETPIHHLDDENLFGTQIRKIIVGDLDRKAIYTTPSGDKMTGQELLNLFNELISKDLESIYNELKTEIKDFPKLVEKVKQEVLDRGMESKYVEALTSTPDGKTVLPLWHPLIAYKVETLLNSIVKNAGTKIKFNGGSFYNASAFGFEDDLDVKFNNNGSIDYFEVKMPAWSKDIIEKLADKDGFIDPKKLEELGLDTGIVYRIPTENKYSMFRIKVKEFTPDVAGGHIIMPTIITKIAGLDFDIDKVYAMLYNHKVVDGKIVKVDPMSNTKEGRQNRLLELMQAVLTNKNTLKQQLTPGGFPTLTKLKEEYKQYTSKGNLDFFSPLTRTEIFTRNMTGLELIGIFANFNSCHQLYENAKTKLKFTENNAILFDNKIKRSLSDRKDNTEGHRNITDNIAEFLAASVDNAKDPIASYLNINTYTADVIGMIVSVGYSIDTAIAFVNQPIIRKFVEIYFNEKGKLSDTVVLNKTMDDFKAKVKNQIPDNHAAVGGLWNFDTQWLNSQIKFNKDVEGRSSDFYLKQMQVLRAFETYKKQSKKLSELVAATKVADSGAGPTFADTNAKLRSINKVTSKLFADTIEGAKEFFSEDSPMVNLNKYFIESTTKEFFNDDRITYLFNPAVQDIITQIEELKDIDLNPNEIKNIQENFITFLATDFDKYNHADSKKLLNKTAENLRKYKLEQKGKSKYEPFIAYLKVENNTDPVTKDEIPSVVVFDGLLGNNEYLQEVMRTTWEDMLSTGDNEERQLAEDLLRYTFYSNGFSFGPSTFYHIAPVSYFANLQDSQGELFSKYLQQKIDETKYPLGEDNNKLGAFTEQYIRNNFQKLSFIKKAREDENNKNITVIKKTKEGVPTEIVLNAEMLDKSNLVRKVGNLRLPEKYVKFFDEKKKKSYLFRLTSNTGEGAIYERIPTLGFKRKGIGALEYDLNDFNLESQYNFNGSWKSGNNIVSLQKQEDNPFGDIASAKDISNLLNNKANPFQLPNDIKPCDF